MDELSQKKFDEIIKKEITGLTESDIAFLRARSPYLNPVQKEVYKEVLERKIEPKVKSDPRRSRSYRAMQKEANELGLPFIGVSREELERSIDTAKGPK